MKKLLISALMMITLYGVQVQTMEKGYFNYIQTNDPKQIQPFEWRMFPKPLSVKKTHNKVIVTFDRKEWERMQFMHRRRMMNHKLPPHPMWRNK